MWNRVLTGKLTGTQVVKKYTAFYGTRTFIAAFNTAHHLSVSLNQINPFHAAVSLLEDPF